MAEAHPLDLHLQDKDAAASLAARARCSVSHLRNIRDGRKMPSLPLAKRLSEAIGKPIEAFLTECEPAG